MKIVPITRNKLVFDPDDWGRLRMLKNDFDKVCDSQPCGICPLRDFCHEHENPADFLKSLHEFLDDYSKERE